MKYYLLIISSYLICFHSFAQSTSGKTYDTDPIPFAKAPILKWISDDKIDDEPAWEGFLLVKAKLNGVYDITGGLQAEETFNVGQIDVWGNDDRKRFHMDMHQTQVRLWSKRKTATGDFVGYFEGDFWAGNNQFRMRQAWFDFKFLHIGQDWSFFGDKDVWPNVLDWDGPPSGVWRRAPQIKFYFETDSKWDFEFGIENPGAEFRFNEEIDPNLTSASYPVMPDIIGAVKKRIDFGYFRLSTIYRNLNYDNNGKTEHVSGYGASLSAYFKTNEVHTNAFQFQIVGGKGIASYLASFGGRNYDGVPTGTGSVSAVPVFGGWVTYEHYFSDQWHANLTLGFSDFQTPEISNLEIGPDAYAASNTEIALDHSYLVVNLMFDPTPGLTFGIEYNLGSRDLYYEGTIDMNGTPVSSIQQGRSAQRIGFGAFFDF